MDTKGISKLDLKRRNRRQILLAIRQAGTLARVDIASKLSLTRAAVTIITNQMINQNILEDLNTPLPVSADEPPKKGRKKTMIRINPTYRYPLGAVIEEDFVSVGISNLPLEAQYYEMMPLTDDTEADEIIAFIVKSCKKLIKKAGLSGKQILGLGVGVIPSRWSQLRAEENQDHQVHFSKLTYMLEMELSIPVCAANAVSLYAMANIPCGTSSTANQLLLYTGQNYHFATVTDNMLVGGVFANTALVDRIVINPNGAKAKGYPDGSVHAEMIRDAVDQKVAKICGKKLSIDELNNAFDNKDPRIYDILERQLVMTAVLIHNLSIGHRTTTVIMQHFRPSEKAKKFLQAKLDSFCEKSGSIRIIYSPIDGDHAFLAGCALAAEKLFYDQGGLPTGE
ncbi:MAG: ROK family protein [Oscillospiraceae bacterium]|nr:ROK family protein [Oscillospiraceae bacterium]